MNIPCKDCITYAICKERILRVDNIAGMKCSLLNKFISQKKQFDTDNRVTEFLNFFGYLR